MTYLRFLRDNASFLLAGFLLTFTSAYGQTYFISIFAGEIRAEFNLSNGGWGVIYTFGTTLSAAVMVWAGGLTDRFRVRHIAMFVMSGLALACLGMAAVPSVAVLVLVIFGLRFAGQGMMVHVAVVAMARWFLGARGRALSISSLGSSVAQALLPLAFVALMGNVSWRWLWVGAAVLVLLTMPAILVLLRQERTPQSMVSGLQAAGMDGRHWTRSEMLRHPLFWLIAPALIGPPAWGTALFFHQVHLTEVKGWALVDFVALLPLFTGAAVLATLVSGAAIDRFGAGRAVVVYMVPFAAGFALLGAAQTIAMAAAGMFFFGMGQGLQATAPAALWAEYFGTRHLGAIKAAATSIMVLGTAIGPGITGVLIDHGWTFPMQLGAMSIYFVLAGISAAVGILRARASLAGALP